jgi:hypothetical protein
VSELALALHLGAGCIQPPLDAVRAIGVSGAQAPFEVLERRRSYEDQDGLWHLPTDGGRALDIGAHQHIFACGKRIENLLTGHTVPSAVDLGVLQQAITFDQSVEGSVGQKVILDPVPLAGAGRTGCRGDHAMKGMPPALQFVKDAVLADA